MGVSEKRQNFHFGVEYPFKFDKVNLRLFKDPQEPWDTNQKIRLLINENLNMNKTAETSGSSLVLGMSK